jgi:hypothetical protein
MSPLLLIIILIILFGGGLGYHSNWGYYGVGPWGGIGGLLVLLLIVFFLFGR